MMNGRTWQTHVLTVGQTLADRRRLSACLPEGRWQVHHASAVRAAIDMLRSIDYDAVITEILLPDGPWTELRDAGSSCPIIVAANSVDARVWADALAQGAYDVLVKPYNTEELLYVLQSACLRRVQAARSELLPTALR